MSLLGNQKVSSDEERGEPSIKWRPIGTDDVDGSPPIIGNTKPVGAKIITPMPFRGRKSLYAVIFNRKRAAIIKDGGTVR